MEITTVAFGIIDIHELQFCLNFTFFTYEPVGFMCHAKIKIKKCPVTPLSYRITPRPTREIN